MLVSMIDKNKSMTAAIMYLTFVRNIISYNGLLLLQILF